MAEATRMESREQLEQDYSLLEEAARIAKRLWPDGERHLEIEEWLRELAQGRLVLMEIEHARS